MKKTVKKTLTKKAVKKSKPVKKVTVKKGKKAVVKNAKTKKVAKVSKIAKKKITPIIDDTDITSSKFSSGGDGMYDENGDWNGSTITDIEIEKIKDPKEKELVKEYDRLREQLVELREQDDRDLAPDISNLVMRIQSIQAKLNEINPNKYI